MATRTSGNFDAVYRAHFADLRRFIFQLVQDPAVSDELAQDAFVKALGAWDRYRGEAPERIWLFRIARNVCLDYLRSPRSRAGAMESLDAAGAEGLEPSAQGLTLDGREPQLSVEQTAQQAEMTECVRRFILSLPETLRTPLILHDMHGFTNEQIAHVLQCSLDAAKMRLHRARSKLRGMMEERCDLFHDERNILSCLPALPVETFISLDEITQQTGSRRRSV